MQKLIEKMRELYDAYTEPNYSYGVIDCIALAESEFKHDGWIEIKGGCQMPPDTAVEIWVTLTDGEVRRILACNLIAYYCAAWKYAEKKPEPFTPKPETK